MAHAVSQGTPAGTSGLVRVTVASGTRRVDLVLPGSIPVAELVPELARSVGLLDAGSVHGGYRLVLQDGRQLASDSGLVMQGVEDGGVLTVAAGAHDEPPRVYDDVVEAMADAVERELVPWEPAAGRRTALVAGSLLLLLGAGALLLQRGPDTAIAAAAAAITAALLVAGAITLSRAQHEREAAVCVAWMGVVYAAVAGLLLVPDGPVVGSTATAAGAAAAVAGLLCLVGLESGRPLLMPAPALGALIAVAALVMDGAGLDAARVLTTVMVLGVLFGSVLPWMALAATRTRTEQLYSAADITSEPQPIDPQVVAEDARLGHEILLAMATTVGLLLVLAAPLAVALGVAGALTVVAASLVVMLRTRQYRTAGEVLFGLGSGVAGLAVTAASILVLHPGWGPTLAVVLAVTGALLLAATLVPRPPSVRSGRFGDIAEVTALVSLLPLLVLALGVIDKIRG